MTATSQYGPSLPCCLRPERRRHVHVTSPAASDERRRRCLRCRWRPRQASVQPPRATDWSLLGDSGKQLLDVGRPDPRDLIVAGMAVKRAVAPRRDIAEGGRSEERVEERVQKAQRRFPGLQARLVHQSAQTRPDRGAPTGAANLRWLIVEYQKGAGVGS